MIYDKEKYKGLMFAVDQGLYTACEILLILLEDVPVLRWRGIPYYDYGLSRWNTRYELVEDR